ncbi:EAL domain-containing protein [Hyphomicrobium sp. CS1GBMeth3]|uniref:putative bifunctional diguanylate cyclase/phosphodiesterase n=1 Tax=Hyphomicrobium sp. CS1GBMeth3 TaxID=1892845 RepID=UPI000A478783|nr:EAL domain-containing protein [Hyphomicrobium sp. CS1GBMeth3]
MNLTGPKPVLANTVPVQTDAGIDTYQLLEQMHKLAQLNARFEIALNTMTRGLSMFDADGNLIVCNELYRQTYDLPEELTLDGTPFSRIIAYHAAKEGRSGSASELKRQQSWIARYLSELKHGEIFSHTHKLENGRFIHVTIQPLQDGGWVDLQEDVTEKMAARERMTWLARHCPLTEIANRFHLRERLEESIPQLGPGRKLAVHLIGLDLFKQVNDAKGHASGDTVLKAAAKRMLSALRENDLVGRVGGDEFAIIQLDIAGPDDAVTFARRIVETLNAPYRVLGSNVEIGASVGTSFAPDHGSDHDTLFRKAGMALHRAKRCGRRSSHHVYSAEIEALALERMELSGALREALARRELGLHYQPIVDVKAGTVTGCEALMRWCHPQLGMVPPATFIPIAERSGLIVAMGDWALRQACHDAAGWPSDIPVSVNMSAVELDQCDLATRVQRALDDSGLDAWRLEIELTERAFLHDAARTLGTLEQIRGLGVRVVLDDFGSGFASLNHLHSFTFDKLKIDQSFISEMANCHDSRAIFNSVTELAKTLGMGPVAEGIEGLKQLEGVAVAGCEEMQGFYFSQPVPSVDLEAALEGCVTRLSRSHDVASLSAS